MLPRILSLIFVSFILASALPACSGPCQQLAEHICGCRPSQTEEQQCLQEVSSSGRSASDMDNQTCDALLSTCTCDALEKHDYAACGLAKEKP